ncbi:MAG: conserved rane protein of unknown function [Candidatus Eremiobacteraeota bacterium]|nr:conserved rane protein of unknown function [Candidatus Eremiobacteraeota bacterium]
MVIVGILVALALSRVVPDFVRVVYPLGVFGYTTDGDANMIHVPAPAKTAAPAAHAATPSPAKRLLHRISSVLRPERRPRTGETILLGDHVRVDRIKPLDRKLGIVGHGFTYDNPQRYLPIERNGTERVLHLVAIKETNRNRFLDLLRIVLFVGAVSLGAILFLVKPSIATGAFFVFCLAGVEAPSTYFDGILPPPWRQVSMWIGDTIRGAARPALMLFALCLIDGDADAPRERIFACVAAGLAVILGTLNAYAQWSLNYAAVPAERLDVLVMRANYAVSATTVVALVIAFWRARHNDRHRIGWIAAGFLFAGAARLASDQLYPSGYIPVWFNSILVSMTIVPIVTIGIAVVRHQFFNVDFVVSRAVVYVAITAAFIGTITVAEEIGTYAFYNNTDFAYGYLIAVSMVVALFTGRLMGFLNRLVDRFIFRDRGEQRQALEFIAGYILDAETVEDVYRALLQDAAHALKLSFGGILARQPDGGYLLAESFEWPADFVIKLGPSDELTRAITRTRGALTFTGKDTRLIQKSFPNERLTFAAPIFFDRRVSGIVVYGHNVSGLDLDPDEREHLIRVVAHASIALNAIELTRYRDAAEALGTGQAPLSAPLPGTG